MAGRICRFVATVDLESYSATMLSIAMNSSDAVLRLVQARWQLRRQPTEEAVGYRHTFRIKEQTPSFTSVPARRQPSLGL
jgi:hypothetical protein